MQTGVNSIGGAIFLTVLSHLGSEFPQRLSILQGNVPRTCEAPHGSSRFLRGQTLACAAPFRAICTAHSCRAADRRRHHSCPVDHNIGARRQHDCSEARRRWWRHPVSSLDCTNRGRHETSDRRLQRYLLQEGQGRIVYSF